MVQVPHVYLAIGSRKKKYDPADVNQQQVVHSFLNLLDVYKESGE